jgi:phosphoribosylformylglycinamidine cyclo-ligase
MGTFGGLFRSPGAGSILVSSIDGVGTKLNVAHMADKHDTVGQDLVNHCVNDILVQGARPLFFLDYVGAARLDPNAFEQVVKGLCKACEANGCALLGGETAEMPGLYPKGEYDLVGAIVGAVEKKKLVTGERIKPGDVLIGLRSSGLHTNGYSLARKVIFKQARLRVEDPLPGTKQSVGNLLLAVHRSYLKPVLALREEVNVLGMAHITGGGLVDNVPRILPDNVNAVVDRGTWRVPRIFEFIEKQGGIDHDEMYRVFNMGIGYVIVVHPASVEKSLEILRANGEKPVVIGEIEKGEKTLRFG